MAKKIEADYHALAKKLGIKWLGPCLPQTTQKKTLWRCARTHVFPRDYGSINFKWLGCPICKGGKPRLVDAYSDQVNQYFDPELNRAIEIDFIMSGSNKQIEWYCNEHDYTWSASPLSIVRSWESGRSGCSVCSGTKKKTKTDYHALAKKRGFEWLGPQLPQATHKNTLWRCPKGHIFPRAYGNLLGAARECPICNGGLPRLVDAYLEQVDAYFDPERNPDLEIAFIMCGSHQSIEWYCKDHDYQWPARPYTISISWDAGRSGCSVCSGVAKKTADDYHELARRRGFKWKGTKVPKDTKEKSDWFCEKKDHPINKSYNEIDQGQGCSVCSEQVISPEHNLAIKFPEVAKIWHPTKNGDLRPEAVTPHSHDKEIWWLCPKTPDLHEWPASPKSVIGSYKTHNTGCPYCSGQKVHPEESLGALFPELAAYWHPTKNGDLTPFEVSYGSGKPVYWLCNFQHTTYNAPNTRTAQGGRGCGKCANQTSRLEIRLHVELKTFINEVGWRRKLDGRECDIYLPSARVAIEVDGYKWHKDKHDSDQQKTDVFEAKGLTVVRVREIPLPSLRQVDVLFKTSQKQLIIVQDLIRVLLTLGCLNKSQTNKAEAYLVSQDYAAEPAYRKILAQLPRPPAGESLLDKVPEISDHWDYDENAPLLPEMYTASSNKKVYWRCGIETHKPYRVSIKERVTAHRRNGTNCKQCQNDKKWTPSPQELRDAYASMRMGEIAKRYGVSRGTVRNRMIEYGISRRTPGQNTL